MQNEKFNTYGTKNDILSILFTFDVTAAEKLISTHYYAQTYRQGYDYACSMFTGRLVVDLIDTSGDQDVNIADLLIHERLASPATENGSDGNRDRIQKTFVKNSQLHYVPG